MQNMANLWTPTYHFTGYDFLRAVLSALSTSSVHNDCQKNNLLAKISICPALTYIKYPHLTLRILFSFCSVYDFLGNKWKDSCETSDVF